MDPQGGLMPTFHHMGLTVSDIEVSYRFYTGLVGMHVWDQSKELDVDMGADVRPAEDHDFISVRSDSFDQLTNNPGSEIKYVNLQSADGQLILQLIQYVAGGAGALELDHNRCGSPHLSFFVEDVDRLWQEVEARSDVQAVSAVVQITPAMRSFYVADPDGVPVELIEVHR
jgi:catechol 2,3-dioxygenase-like lactoylglutathione lyase family enzyme